MLGQRVTRFRKSFTEAACQYIEKPDAEKDGEMGKVTAVAKKLNARGSNKGKVQQLPPAAAFTTPTPIDMRKRRRCKQKLTL